MSRRARRLVWTGLVGIGVLAAVGLDLGAAIKARRAVYAVAPKPAGTLELARSTVAIASSEDAELFDPAPLDAALTYEQIDAVVRRALDLDTSERSIRNVIKKEDWVAIKVNMVTAPIVDDNGTRQTGFWRGDVEHWGDVTDLRVVKSVINYLIEKVGPRRITIVEGSGEWSRRNQRDKGYGNSYDHDGWDIRWAGFDNLCYAEMIEEFNRMQSTTHVDSCDLNDDDYVFVPVPGGAYQCPGVSTRSGSTFGYFVPIPGTGVPREGYYYPVTMLEADKLISIPAMKTNIGGATLVIKNYVGTLASRPYGDGTSKSQMDSESYERGMTDLFSLAPAVYAVVGGFSAEEGSWGGIDRYNLTRNIVVCGGDPVAAEATVLRSMGFNPYDIESLYLAAEKGLGTFDEDLIDIVGRPLEEVRYPFKQHTGYRIIGFQRWLVNGPHDGSDMETDVVGDPASLVPAKGDMSGGKPWVVYEHPYTYPEAFVDLREFSGGGASNSTYYAFAVVQSERDQDGYLWVGADDNARVWLNGELVAGGVPTIGAKLGSSPGPNTPVRINEGANRLMIKIVNATGAMGFVGSIVDDRGNTLMDIKPVLPGDTGTLVKASPPSAVSVDAGYVHPPQTRAQEITARIQARLAVLEGARVVEVRVDLTPVGGASDALMYDDGTHGDSKAGDGIYTVEHRLTEDVSSGRKAFLIKALDGAGTPAYGWAFQTVYPAGDVWIYQEGMEQGWEARSVMRADIDPECTDVAYNGTYSLSITSDRSSMFDYVCSKEGGMDTFGYTHLSFYLNPGTAKPNDVMVGSLRLVGTLGLDLSSEGWQEVSIPLATLGLESQKVTSFRVIVSGTGTIYVDNMRFVASVPVSDSVEDPGGDALVPVGIALGQNYPNPFNAQTTIHYALPEASHVRLVICDMLGRRVRVLLDRPMPAGFHRLEWNGTDDQGDPVAAGVYAYLLESEGSRQIKRMVFLK